MIDAAVVPWCRGAMVPHCRRTLQRRTEQNRTEPNVRDLFQGPLVLRNQPLPCGLDVYGVWRGWDDMVQFACKV